MLDMVGFDTADPEPVSKFLAEGGPSLLRSTDSRELRGRDDSRHPGTSTSDR